MDQALLNNLKEVIIILIVMTIRDKIIVLPDRRKKQTVTMNVIF